MQFNSHFFILFMLPCSVLGYFLFNKFNSKAGKSFLIAVSLIFYYPAGINGMIVLCGSIIINYLLTYGIYKTGKKNLILVTGLVLNVGILFYCKYYNFFVSNISIIFHIDYPTKDIIIPLGISFYTFHQVMYLMEAYRKQEILGGFEDYMLYVLYFPKLLMGPISSPNALIGQFNDQRRKKINTDNLVSGIQIFGYGLFKKVLLADTFAKVVSWGFTDLTVPTSGDFILIMLSYTFQIYFDFSGYSDMAIGISKMLNIDLPMNFDSPYKAVTIRDFWRRWHISLTKFLTDYVYIPLGGSKKGKNRTYLNTMIVFLISGLWHGANWTFILWGVLHGLGSVFDRMMHYKYSKLPKLLRWSGTFIFINILWLLFRSDSIGDWIFIMKNIVSCANMSVSEGLINCFSLPEFNIVFTILHISGIKQRIRGFEMLIMLCFSFVLCLCCKNNYCKERWSLWSLVFVPIVITWSLICLGTESTYVYFDF